MATVHTNSTALTRLRQYSGTWDMTKVKMLPSSAPATAWGTRWGTAELQMLWKIKKCCVGSYLHQWARPGRDQSSHFLFRPDVASFCLESGLKSKTAYFLLTYCWQKKYMEDRDVFIKLDQSINLLSFCLRMVRKDRSDDVFL